MANSPSSPEQSPPVISPRAERWIATAMIVGFTIIALGFSLAPIFEGLDETAHYRFIADMLRAGDLPDPHSAPRAENHQAPLYYVIVAPIVVATDAANFERVAPRNPFFAYEFTALGNDNKNLRLHSAFEAFPYTGHPVVLAAHLIRLVSIAMGVATLIIAYKVLLILFPLRPDLRLMALGVISFWPQFIYLCSIISNDLPLFLLATLALYLILKQIPEGPTLKSAIILGVVLGAALLSKSSGNLLALTVGAWVLMDWKRSWRYAIVTLVITLAIALWWYIRNIIIMGDPTGMGMAMQEWQGGPIPLGPRTIPTLLGALPFIHMTLWARFGNTSVPVSDAIYLFFDILSVLALAGFVVWAVRAYRQTWASLDTTFRRQIILTAIYTFSWLFVLAYFASIATFANQARYIFPGIVGLGALIALGLNTWFPKAISARLSLAVPAVMAAISCVSLVVYFTPALRPLPLPATIEHPLSIRFGDVAELIGTSTSTPHARPGETITFSLYWRALKPSERNLNTFVHTVDSDVIRRDSYPATGNLLSVDWKPGQTWEERYVITIPEDAGPQGSYDLIVGLYDAETQEALPSLDADGNPISPSVGQFTIDGAAQSLVPFFLFGNAIGMAN